MKTLHENMHSDMWEVFRLVGVCLDAMGEDDAQNTKARDLIAKLLADVARFATESGSPDSIRVDAATCTLDELRESCSAIREASLQYINSLTDHHILENPAEEVEGSLYFKLSHAHFASAWHIGQLHLILGIEE